MPALMGSPSTIQSCPCSSMEISVADGNSPSDTVKGPVIVLPKEVQTPDRLQCKEDPLCSL